MRTPRHPSVRVFCLGLLLTSLGLFLSSCGGGVPTASGESGFQSSRISYLDAPASRGALRPNQLPPPERRPTAGPSIHGSNAIVLDARTGRILYEKNADQQRAVASTQKMLTALLAYERGGFDDYMTIESTDGAVEPTKVGIRTGERYTRRDLTHALLVRSGNDVARALARDHSGSVPAFATAMTRRAQQIGMHSSRFVNPHGLTEPGQYSTARDVATLALRIWHTPVLRDMVADRRFTLRSASGRAIPLKTTNKLAERWPACRGMKTGYTNAAGKCLASAAVVNGRELICVILGSNSSHIWDDSQRLLEYGATR